MGPPPLTLSQHWVEELSSQPETGLGYQIVDVLLVDGRRFKQVVVFQGSAIHEVRGRDDIPFRLEEIERIVLTHEKWKFKDGEGGPGRG